MLCKYEQAFGQNAPHASHVLTNTFNAASLGDDPLACHQHHAVYASQRLRHRKYETPQTKQSYHMIASHLLLLHHYAVGLPVDSSFLTGVWRLFQIDDTLIHAAYA